MFSFQKSKNSMLFRGISSLILIAFSFTSVIQPSYAQSAPQTILNLPNPGSLLNPTAAFTPVMITGVNIDADNPLRFDFIVNEGDQKLDAQAFNDETMKLIKYFLAALTTPESEMWVNLSPYEKDRIIPAEFGKTEMGRDLLAQDYLLKQLSASLMYPESDLGKEFWKKVQDQAGTDIPVNAFNKVWIVPQEAKIYEHAKGAFIVKSHLKVMLDEDYIALEANKNTTEHGLGSVKAEDLKPISGVTSQIVRDVVIPAIEKEVNEGSTFANLRQIYNSVILATWYKQALKNSLLGKGYVNRHKTDGIENNDPEVAEKIYQEYLKAFEVGAYDYIKEEYNPEIQAVESKKYISGGVVADVSNAMLTVPGNENTRKVIEGQAQSRVARVELGNERIIPVGEVVDGDVSNAMLVSDILPEKLQKILGLNEKGRQQFFHDAGTSGEQAVNIVLKHIRDLLNIADPLVYNQDIVISNSNLPTKYVTRVDKDGKERLYALDNNESQSFIEGENSTHNLTAVPTPFGTNVSRHIRIVVPTKIDNPKDTIKRLGQGIRARPEKTELKDKLGIGLREAPDATSVELEEYELGVIDTKSFSINSVTTKDHPNGVSTIDFYLWTKAPEGRKNYTEAPSADIADILDKTPTLQGSLQETSRFNTPKNVDTKPTLVGIHGGRGRISIGAFMNFILSEDLSRLQPRLINGATIKELYLAFTNDRQYGRILKPKRGDKVTMAKDNEGNDYLNLRFKGQDIVVYATALRNDNEIAFLPYRKYGIRGIIDAVDGKTEEQLNLHIAAGAEFVINTAPSKKGPDGLAPRPMIPGINDTDFRFGNKYSIRKVISQGSCTTCAVAPVVEALQHEGGRQAAKERNLINQLLVRAGLEPVREDKWTVHSVFVNTNHASTESDGITKKGSQSSAFDVRLGSSGASIALSQLLEGIDPKDITVVSQRVPTTNISTAEVSMVISREDGFGELTKQDVIKRFFAAKNSPHMGGIIDVRDVSNSEQIKGTSASSVILEKSIQVIKLGPNTWLVEVDSGYDNEWSFSGRTDDSVAIAAEDLPFPKIETMNDLLNGLDANAISYSNVTKRFKVAKGGENRLKLLGGALTLLDRESQYGATKEIRALARLIIQDVANDLNTYLISKDDVDKARKNGATGLGTEGVTHAVGTGSASATASFQAIFANAIETGTVPVINVNDLETQYNRRTPEAQPQYVAEIEAETPQEDILDREYINKVTASALVAAVQAGYSGPIFLSKDVEINPANFEAYRGDYNFIKTGKPEVAAVEYAKQQIKSAAEQGVYNFRVNLSNLISADRQQDITEIEDSIIAQLKGQPNNTLSDKTLRSVLSHVVARSILGNEYADRLEKQGKDVIDSTLNDEQLKFAQGLIRYQILDRVTLRSLLMAYELAYKEAELQTQDILGFTRQTEKDLGLKMPMALSFTLDQTGGSLVVGALLLQERLAKVQNQRELVQPGRITIFQQGAASDVVAQEQRIADYITSEYAAVKGIPASASFGVIIDGTDKMSQASQIRRFVLDSIFQAVRTDPKNVRARDLVQKLIEFYEVALFKAGELKDVSEFVALKIKAAKLETSRGGRRFAKGRKEVWGKVYNPKTLKNIGLDDFYRMAQQMFNETHADIKEADVVDFVNEIVYRAFSQEIWSYLLNTQHGQEIKQKLNTLQSEGDNAMNSGKKTDVAKALNTRYQPVLQRPTPITGQAPTQYQVGEGTYQQRRQVVSDAVQEALNEHIPFFGKDELRQTPALSNSVESLIVNFSDLVKVIPAERDASGDLIKEASVELVGGAKALVGNERVVDLSREVSDNPSLEIRDTAFWLASAITNARGISVMSGTSGHGETKLKAVNKQGKPYKFVVPAVNMRSGGIVQIASFYRVLALLNAVGYAELAQSEMGYSGLKNNKEFSAVVQLAHAYIGAEEPIIIQADHRQLKAENMFALDEKKLKESSISASQKVYITKNWQAMTYMDRDKTGFVDLNKRQKEIEAYDAETFSALEARIFNIDMDISTIVDPVALEKLYTDSIDLDEDKLTNNTKLSEEEKKQLRKQWPGMDAKAKTASGFANRLNTEGLSPLMNEIRRRQHGESQGLKPGQSKPTTGQGDFFRSRTPETMDEIGVWIDKMGVDELKTWVDENRVARYMEINYFTAVFTAERIVALRRKEAQMKKQGLMPKKLRILIGAEERHTDWPTLANKPSEVEGTIALTRMIDKELAKYAGEFKSEFGEDLVGYDKMSYQTGTAHGIAGRDINTAVFLIHKVLMKLTGVQHGASKLEDAQLEPLKDQGVDEIHLATQLANITLETASKESLPLAEVIWDMLHFFMDPTPTTMTPRLREFLYAIEKDEKYLYDYAKTHSKNMKKFGESKDGKPSPFAKFISEVTREYGYTPDTKEGRMRILSMIIADGPDTPSSVRSTMKDFVKYLNAPLLTCLTRLKDDNLQRVWRALDAWQEKIFKLLGAVDSADHFEKYNTGIAPLPRMPEALRKIVDPKSVKSNQEQIDLIQSVKDLITFLPRTESAVSQGVKINKIEKFSDVQRLNDIWEQLGIITETDALTADPTTKEVALRMKDEIARELSQNDSIIFDNLELRDGLSSDILFAMQEVNGAGYEAQPRSAAFEHAVKGIDFAMKTNPGVVLRALDVGPAKKGGIDLNPMINSLSIERDGNGFVLPPVDPAMLQQLREASGLSPVIIHITPVSNLPLLLGLAEETDKPVDVSQDKDPYDRRDSLSRLN